MHFKLLCKTRVTSFQIIYVIEYIWNGDFNWDLRTIGTTFQSIRLSWSIWEETKGNTSVGILKHFTKIEEKIEEDFEREILMYCDFHSYILQSRMDMGIFLFMSMLLRKSRRGFINMKDMVNWYVKDRVVNYLGFGITKTWFCWTSRVDPGKKE